MFKLHQVLKSSRAAIDLASIMVGIIVIGLIGGVIAATVFAVIPWSQDKAAKQQLDSIASAQNAYRGLSTDKTAGLKDTETNPTDASDANQVVLNSSFTGSKGLEKNGLLASSDKYCTVPTVNGSDYNAYVVSSSGKVFASTSKGVQNTPVQDALTCLGQVTNGSLTLGASNPPAEPKLVYSETFESYKSTSVTPPGWSAPATPRVGINTYNSAVHSGQLALSATLSSSSTETFGNIKLDLTKAKTPYSFIPGKNYTVGVWLRGPSTNPKVVNPSFTVNGITSGQSIYDGTAWHYLEVTFTATETTESAIVFQSNAPGPVISGSPSGYNYFGIDDITITQNN